MFKKGDKVRCVDDDLATPFLIQGHVYTVQGVVGDDICFLEGSTTRWMQQRFELYSEPSVAFRKRTVIEASADGGKTWIPVPEDL
jgi:hypothetical protein